METIELNSSADPEQKNVILMPRTHTHSAYLLSQVERFRSPQNVASYMVGL